MIIPHTSTEVWHITIECLYLPANLGNNPTTHLPKCDILLFMPHYNLGHNPTTHPQKWDISLTIYAS